MEHSFDIDIAKEYGIPCAVLLKHIYYWVEKNRTNEKHYIDGCYWTYNSLQSFCKLFPYLSDSTIKRSLKKLAEDGLIAEAFYNDQPFDRTKWYTVTEKGYAMIEKGKRNFVTDGFGQNDNDHLVKLTTSDEVKMSKPIPYINHINTHINNNISNSKELDCPTRSNEESNSGDLDVVISTWNALSGYGVPPVKKLVSTTNRAKMLRARIREYGTDDVIKAIENIRHSDFLTGKADKYFMISFDWFVKPNNFPKVLEGKYNDKKRGYAGVTKQNNGRQG